MANDRVINRAATSLIDKEDTKRGCNKSDTLAGQARKAWWEFNEHEI